MPRVKRLQQGHDREITRLRHYARFNLAHRCDSDPGAARQLLLRNTGLLTQLA